jgi:hypothetical protein
MEALLLEFNARDYIAIWTCIKHFIVHQRQKRGQRGIYSAAKGGQIGERKIEEER